MKVYLFELYELLNEKFPDAVEFWVVDTKTVYERTFPAGSGKLGKISIYELKELEPETEIYAVISPVTHIVYLNITLEDLDSVSWNAPDSSWMIDKVIEDIASASGVPSNLIHATPSDSFSIQDLQRAVDLVFPPMYYNADEHTERGKIIYVKASDLHPEFVVFHPVDFEEVQRKLSPRRLVHISDYMPRDGNWSPFRLFEVCEHGLIKNLCPICEPKPEDPDVTPLQPSSS